MDFSIARRYRTMLRDSENIALNGHINSYDDLGVIGELHYGLTEFFLKFNTSFDEPDREILLQRLGQYNTLIIVKFAENFFYPMFYIYKKYDNNNQEYLREIKYSMHYLIATRGVVRYSYLKKQELAEISPIWGNFFNHIKYPMNTFPRIISDKRKESFGLISYCILNLIDTLIEMNVYILNSEMYKGELRIFWEEELSKAINNVENMLDNLDDDFLKAYSDDDFLQNFLTYLINKWKNQGYSNGTLNRCYKNRILSIEDIEQVQLGWRQKCWAILSNLFSNSDIEAKKTLGAIDAQHRQGDRRSDHLTFLVELFTRKEENRNSSNNLLPVVEKLDTTGILKLIFEKIDSLHRVEISTDEEEKVMRMRDEDLRPLLCKIIIQSRNIDPTEKNKIMEESRKPHARGEISDIDFKLQEGDESIFVGIPLKSGVETSEARISERYISQLIRPLSVFGSRRSFSCLVSPKPLSLEFDRTIKSIQTNLGLPVEAITGQHFIKLLKAYDEI